ncbi:hypothetical protein [Niallia sp. NCCP-28]|nr:hypothetical protein [Niallia sp. NCCP-28]GKU83275.1 hypothetical protein NCCP28_26710 [Niallia sp. NCCP-28]
MFPEKNDIISDEFLDKVAKEINEIYGWHTKLQTEEDLEEEKEN